jgi:hypothetical protein
MCIFLGSLGNSTTNEWWMSIHRICCCVKHEAKVNTAFSYFWNSQKQKCQKAGLTLGPWAIGWQIWRVILLIVVCYTRRQGKYSSKGFLKFTKAKMPESWTCLGYLGKGMTNVKVWSYKLMCYSRRQGKYSFKEFWSSQKQNTWKFYLPWILG